MSMHKKPLTVIEETGLIAHGFGRDIGKPSMAADIFRTGVAWGLASNDGRIANIKKELEHGMPFDEKLRKRYEELLISLVAQQPAQEQAQKKIADLEKAYQKELNDSIQTIEQRDYWEEQATNLAQRVGEYFDVPVGEHSNMNCPIEEALKILDGEYVTKFDQQPAWLLKSTQELATHLWQKHYKTESPVFEVLGDLAGVLSQIDNITTGLVREQEPESKYVNGWKHSCVTLMTDGVELWIDRCPHCGKPAPLPLPPVKEASSMSEINIVLSAQKD